ncbi:MhpC Predicted hydrolases or acyltransferases (alpha/beta hydrolase superfamily) [Comamonadaceae bacterium]
MKIRANGIDIEVEDSAAQDASFATKPAVLLIMGLGLQLIAWPPEMVQGLEDAGYRVIRFDNRDVGLSTRMEAAGKPNLMWATLQYKLGFTPAAPYSLSDMAADAIGVLDVLGVRQAHVVGVSMGGMIAQRVALAVPQRVLSLTSIMSSSGAKGLPGPSPEVLRAMLSRPTGNSKAAVIEHSVGLFRAIGSPAFPFQEAELHARITRGVERAFYPVGTLRQMVAVVSDHTRAALLGRIAAPTLVVHGTADPLVPLACGQDTARRIPGAKLVTIEGMGHDLPPEPVRRILAALLSHITAHPAA